jgi:Protein of unknown function (DUF2599)
MRFITAALGAVLLTLSVALLSAGPATADDAPQFIDHTQWVHWGDLSSLRVYPTHAARVEAAQLGTTAEGNEAWLQVLASAPDADIPGMREQFLCHWELAEFAYPGKTSWNLEPWRPLVDAATMIEAGCNPGGTEEPF